MMEPPYIEAKVESREVDGLNVRGRISVRHFPLTEPDEAGSWIAEELKRQKAEMGLV
jgi:hypothetical protein